MMVRLDLTGGLAPDCMPEASAMAQRFDDFATALLAAAVV